VSQLDRGGEFAAIEALESRVVCSAGGIGGVRPSAIKAPEEGLIQAVDHLPHGRFAPITVAAGHKVFFAGTSTFPAGDPTVDVFDENADQWSTITLPDEPAVAAAGTSAMAYFLTNAGVLDIYDSTTDQWSRKIVPASTIGVFSVSDRILLRLATGTPQSKASDFPTFSVPTNRDGLAGVVGTKIAFFHGHVFDFFDTLTGRWQATPASLPFTPLSVSGFVAIGSKLLFTTAPDSEAPAVTMYDTITERVSSVAAPPAGVTFFPSQESMVELGDKAVIAAYFQPDVRSPIVPVVASYDSSSDTWEIFMSAPSASTPAGKSSVVSGTKAWFAGNSSSPFNGLDIVNSYADVSPTAVLAGGIKARRHGKVQVALTNVGDAVLPPGATLRLFATLTSGVLDSSSTSLFSVRLKKALPAGATATITLDASAAANLPAGSYHLLATVATSKRHFTPIAATTDVFTVASPSHRGLFAGGPGRI
jgi:hypothetical protein